MGNIIILYSVYMYIFISRFDMNSWSLESVLIIQHTQKGIQNNTRQLKNSFKRIYKHWTE